MLQVFVIRSECKHLLFADKFNELKDLDSMLNELKGGACPICGERVDNTSVVVDEDDLIQFLKGH